MNQAKPECNNCKFAGLDIVWEWCENCLGESPADIDKCKHCNGYGKVGHIVERAK